MGSACHSTAKKSHEDQERLLKDIPESVQVDGPLDDPLDGQLTAHFCQWLELNLESRSKVTFKLSEKN